MAANSSGQDIVYDEDCITEKMVLQYYFIQLFAGYKKFQKDPRRV